VYLVGAGPGDPGLITQRGADLLSRAEVVVYDGLASPVLLRLAPPGCERIYAGKKRSPVGEPLSQADIDRLLVDRARDGKRVVRLKGGDPFVFGRGAEECAALAAAGVRFEVVPGVSAATGVSAYAGIPLTARGVASTVAFATGHEADGGDGEAAVDWSAIARADTVVLFMALTTAAQCCAHLVAAGRDPGTPAAAVHWGTTAAQSTLVSTLGELAGAIADAGLRPPALLIIGEVVRLREGFAWHEARPLSGHRIMVTRAAGQAERVVRAVAELGGEPMVVPLTRVVPLPAPLERLERFAWVVFTSANAVDRFMAELRTSGRDARALAAARLACVGKATAAALGRHGLTADLVPPHGDAAGLARALLAAGSPGPVLMPRAERGREEAVDILTAAGVTVETVAVYRLDEVGADDPLVRSALARLAAGEVSAVAFFAPSQVRALCELADLSRVRVLAAIGETTAEALRQRGLVPAVVASAPDGEALVADIAAALR
jgi:uroporphyrinogen III methyltransferase/synthase